MAWKATFAPLDPRMCADRRFAGAIENRQKGALRRKRDTRRRIENRRQESPSGVIAAAHLVMAIAPWPGEPGSTRPSTPGRAP